MVAVDVLNSSPENATWVIMPGLLARWPVWRLSQMLGQENTKRIIPIALEWIPLMTLVHIALAVVAFSILLQLAIDLITGNNRD